MVSNNARPRTTSKGKLMVAIVATVHSMDTDSFMENGCLVHSVTVSVELNHKLSRIMVGTIIHRDMLRNDCFP